MTWKTRKVGRGIIHCIAECKDCAWETGDYRKAARLASLHVRHHGHTVMVEQGIDYRIEPIESDKPSEPGR